MHKKHLCAKTIVSFSSPPPFTSIKHILSVRENGIFLFTQDSLAACHAYCGISHIHGEKRLNNERLDSLDTLIHIIHVKNALCLPIWNADLQWMNMQSGFLSRLVPVSRWGQLRSVLFSKEIWALAENATREIDKWLYLTDCAQPTEQV